MDLAPGPSNSSAPLISVIVCTRNRKHNVVPTVATILASDHPSFEVLIVDQSDDETTRDAIAPLVEDDERALYFHLDMPGKSRALNFAYRRARGRYLLLTDDDCECPPDWLCEMERAFRSDDTVGCVLGQVMEAPHDENELFVFGYKIDRASTIHSLKEFLLMPGTRNCGMGANSAIRADVAAQLGGWDPCLGPGSRFGSGDDLDLWVRTLLAGYGVHFSPTSKVVHFGFRRRAALSRDMSRIGGGFGACFAKYLRCGVFYHGSWRMFSYNLMRAIGNLFKRHRGFALPKGWLRGFALGLRQPVDRATRCFVETDQVGARKYGDYFGQIAFRSDVAEPARERTA